MASRVAGGARACRGGVVRAADLFSGLGGFGLGAARAGIQVVFAANHWPVAVDFHRRNHPGVPVVCQDLQQADFHAIPEVDLLVASPSCVGHCRARGKDQPRHDAARSTAWAVVSACEARRPALAIVENVPEFLGWSLYPAWCTAMRALGYSLAEHVVDVADLGIPQHRVRLFIVASRSQAPLRLTLPRQEHVPVGSIIDWSAGRWSRVDKPGRAAATLARVRNGRRAFGARFVAPYYGRGSGLTGRSLDRPIGTITTRDRWAVIDGDRMRMLSVQEYARACDFGRGVELPAQKALAVHLLGNAVPPGAAEAVIRAALEAA